MARFYGDIGFGHTVETRPGVWEDVITVRKCSGDVLRNIRRLENSNESVNDNFNVNNSFSIIADGYSTENFYAMRYIVWMGVKWKITTVEVQYPRLVIQVGGVYNGNPPGTSDAA